MSYRLNESFHQLCQNQNSSNVMLRTKRRMEMMNMKRNMQISEDQKTVLSTPSSSTMSSNSSNSFISIDQLHYCLHQLDQLVIQLNQINQYNQVNRSTQTTPINSVIDSPSLSPVSSSPFQLHDISFNNNFISSSNNTFTPFTVNTNINVNNNINKNDINLQINQVLQDIKTIVIKSDETWINEIIQTQTINHFITLLQYHFYQTEQQSQDIIISVFWLLISLTSYQKHLQQYLSSTTTLYILS